MSEEKSEVVVAEAKKEVVEGERVPEATEAKPETEQAEEITARIVVRPDGLYVRKLLGGELSYEKVPSEKYSGQVPKKFRQRHVETLLRLWNLGRVLASTGRELAATREEALEAGCEKIALKQLEGWEYVSAAHVPVARGEKAIGYRVCVYLTPKGEGVVDYSYSEASHMTEQEFIEAKEGLVEGAAPEAATAPVEGAAVEATAAPVVEVQDESAVSKPPVLDLEV